MSKVFTITDGLENLGALRTGGQGSVYKGKRTGSIYSAVKLIPTPILTEDKDDKNYRNFENEVIKLQKVNENPSANVVKILGFGITESGSFPFIEMEYIEGSDLCDLLKPPHNPIFTIKELVKVAGHLAAALAHCHQAGVKHGDIKNNNVKYNVHTGNYILLDFGLAIMSEEQRRTSIRHAGAIEFMAPEQNSGLMLMQTDIYSYGIILYELLAGQVPFPLIDNSDTARNTVMVSHLEKELPDMLALREANLPTQWSKEQKEQEMVVPLWLIDFIHKCLLKDPKARFIDGMVLQDAFSSYSLSLASTKFDGINVDEIVAENDILKKQITSLGDNENSTNSGVQLSTFVFSVMLVSLLSLAVYVAYISFFQSNAKTENRIQPLSQQQQDSIDLNNQGTEIVKPPIIIPNESRNDSVKSTVPIIKIDTIDTTENLTPDTSLKPETIINP